MKNFYIKTESLTKITLLTFLLLAPAISLAEINVKKWTKNCVKDTEVCFVGIKAEISIPGSDKKQTLATTYIQKKKKTERKMDLIDGENKTYKLKEENKLVPILFIDLPLNTDLTKNPLVQIDGKNIINVIFTHCNTDSGCSSRISLNDEHINSFQAGKKLAVTFGVHSKENMSVTFPLKSFTKSYDGLFK